MPISLTCPGCAARMSAPDATAGKKIKCPKCQRAISVPEPDAVHAAEVIEDDPTPAKKEPTSTGKSKAKATTRDDNEDDDESAQPKKKRAKAVAGDDAKEAEESRTPRSKRRPAEEDEQPKKKRKGDPPVEDDGETRRRPKKKKKKARKPAGAPWLLIGGGAVLLIGAVVGVLAATGAFSKKPAENKTTDTAASGPPGTTGPTGPGSGGTPAPSGNPGVFTTSPTQLALSRNGNKLATHAAGVIKVWDLATGGDGVALDDPHNSELLAISADGTRVASFGAKELRVWDTGTHKPIAKTSVDRGGTVGFSPDARFALCFGANRGVTAIDVRSGAVSQFARDSDVSGPAAAAFSPTAGIVAVSAGTVNLGTNKSSQSVTLYQIEGGRRMDGFAPPDMPYSLSYSDSGEVLVGRTSKNLCVWRVDGWKLTTLPFGGPVLGRMQVGPGDRFVAGLEGGRVTVFDLTAGTSRQLATTGCADFVFHPKGLLLVARYKGPLIVVDPVTGAERSGL